MTTPEERKRLVQEYAADFSNRFRVAKDFQHAEEPRQIIGLGVFLAPCILAGIYWSYVDKEGSTRGALQIGFLNAVWGVVVYCFLQTRDGLLVRPHPGFWRVVHGIGLAHLMVVAFLAGSPTKVGRTLVRQLIPGVIEQRDDVFSGTCDLQCELSFRTLKIQLSKLWFYSHLIGWFAKMCIFRDWTFCLILSFAFELVELSFQWLIPELRECWWDSIFLDVALSNMIGMFVGAIVLRLLNAVCYNWLSGEQHDEPTNRLQSVVTRFIPFYWTQYHWSFFRTPERFLHTVVLLILALLTELNVFLMMYALDIPASHWYHKVRVTYLCFLAISGVAETYNYVTTKTKKQRRIGHNAWLFVTIICVEFIVCLRYGSERFRSFIPDKGVLIPWGIALTLLSIWSFFHFSVVGVERLDTPKDLWNEIYIAVKNGRDYCLLSSHNKDINGLITTGHNTTNNIRRRKTNDRMVDQDIRTDFICAIQEEMRKRRTKWGALIYDIGIHIVAIPPLLSFIPIIALVRFYDFD